MKLLIDMNLSPKWVEFLDGAGFESTHWSAVGPADWRPAVTGQAEQLVKPGWADRFHDAMKKRKAEGKG